MDLEDLERRIRERLDAFPPAARAELLHVLTLPDYDRAGRIGEFYGNPRTRGFAGLLIDAEEDKYLRAGARRGGFLRPLGAHDIGQERRLGRSEGSRDRQEGGESDPL